MQLGKIQKVFCNKTGKFWAILISLLLMVGVTVSGTVAFLIHTDGPLQNLFLPSKVTTSVLEDVTSDPQKKQDVAIKNTGDTEAWIRAAVVITWKDANGNVYGKVPTETDYDIDFGTENGWVKGADNYWYYTFPVAAGAQTGDLIESCTVSGDAPEDGYYLNVEIIGSGIQSRPDEVVEKQWANGVNAVKGTGEGRTLDIVVTGGEGQ